MIRYIEKGDIFRIEGVSSYAHGCNCAGAMGKGIAVQFKDKYPDMYLEYKLLCYCAKKTSFAPEMYLIMIMATGIYIILALKQRGEHELK